MSFGSVESILNAYKMYALKIMGIRGTFSSLNI